jgi:hypothetical protein
MAADPVPYDDSCDECDLCCVLAKEVVGDCTKLFWLCKCPTGTLTLQRDDGLGGWVDWSDFDPVDSTYFVYSDDNLYGGTYRLRCELDSGEIYYSNTVIVAYDSDRDCHCTDGTDIKLTRVWFEVEVRPYTRASYAANRVYGTATTYSSYADCNGDTVELWSDGTWDLTVSYYTPDGTTLDFIAQVRLMKSGTDNIWEVTKAWSTVTKGEECYWECFTDLSFDGSAISWPDKDVLATGVFNAFTSSGGSGFDFHYTVGNAIIVREIQIETV